MPVPYRFLYFLPTHLPECTQSLPAKSNRFIPIDMQGPRQPKMQKEVPLQMHYAPQLFHLCVCMQTPNPFSSGT